MTFGSQALLKAKEFDWKLRLNNTVIDRAGTYTWA